MFTPPERPGCKVLIVEDDPLQLRLLSAMTRKLGFASLPATNVAQARALLLTCDIRTVLLDLQLGSEAGLDILRDLSGSVLPRSIIFVSGCDERTRTAAARLAHAQGLHVAGSLSKPAKLSELSALLESRPTCSWAPAPRDPIRAKPEDIAHALRRGEITAEFQPKISLDTGLTVGVEALARWHSPSHGFVAPDIFIPLAETSGQLAKLTEAMLRASLSACARWRIISPEVSVAVNIAPPLIDYQLSEMIDCLLDENQVPARSLVLEITESSLIGDSLLVSDVLTRLRIKGVQLSIDDFGTGHSSLVSLLRMPFNELKLDRLFVAASSYDADAERILRALIVLARELGLRSVAEGVETEEVVERLRRFGCDVAQGWFWAPALKEAELLCWLQEQNTRSNDGSRPSIDGGLTATLSGGL